jgi:hypothetical protein
MAMATDDSERRGAKWGTILHQHLARLSPLKRSIYLFDLAFSHSQQPPATALTLLRMKGSRGP